ncbi:Dabb family protein [Methylibium sp.]|uniref:Dabb family protein n=1 Tax=Methylibium sp. TaxID=2067992 RepID=UPI003D09664A
MIRHIVIWTLEDPADAPRFKALLDSCADLVPGMLAFEVGIRAPGLEANADVVLISAFADAAALDAYQRHPAHQAVAAQLGPMRRERRVVDFERA